MGFNLGNKRGRSWTNPRSDHERRKALNAALGGDREFVAPDDDKDLQCCLPFGKYKGLTLAQVLEQDPGYLHWMGENCELREGPFAAAFAAVCCRYPQRIGDAPKFRRSERF